MGNHNMEGTGWNSSPKPQPQGLQDGKFGSLWTKTLADFKYQPLTSCYLVLTKAVNIIQELNIGLPGSTER